MTRRIVLEDSEIHFFEKLADLSFTEQKDGLWVPPERLALGAVSPRERSEVERLLATQQVRDPEHPDGLFMTSDLIVSLELYRPAPGLPRSAIPVLQYSFPLRTTFTWHAMPDGSIYFADGRRLDGFQVFADIK